MQQVQGLPVFIPPTCFNASPPAPLTRALCPPCLPPAGGDGGALGIVSNGVVRFQNCAFYDNYCEWGSGGASECAELAGQAQGISGMWEWQAAAGWLLAELAGGAGCCSAKPSAHPLSSLPPLSCTALYCSLHLSGGLVRQLQV